MVGLCAVVMVAKEGESLLLRGKLANTAAVVLFNKTLLPKCRDQALQVNYVAELDKSGGMIEVRSAVGCATLSTAKDPFERSEFAS